MGALLYVWLGGLLLWLGLWARLWSLEPPERFDWRGPVLLIVLGLCWPLLLVISVVVLSLDRIVNRREPKEGKRR